MHLTFLQENDSHHKRNIDKKIEEEEIFNEMNGTCIDG